MDLKEIELWKKSFFRDDFSVDNCLAGYTQKFDLETLLRDLKNYGNELQCQMTDILKNETEAIVSLAEHLTNLNSKIDNLSVPISQLREEIRTLYNLVKSAEESYKRVLEDVKNNHSEQNRLHLKMTLIKCCAHINVVLPTMDEDSSDSLLTLERLVNNYSFNFTYMKELNAVTIDIKGMVARIEHHLSTKLNKIFLTAYKKSDKHILRKCLRMYINLQRQEEVQTVVQIEIIRPLLEPLFMESYLEKCDYNIDRIYTEVITILETKLEILAQIVSENPDLNCFNFILNSFWRELDKQSREGLPHIVAPGNPELFQKRFTSTWNLLKFIAEKCYNKSLIYADNSFLNHIKRFNLPVYFEIKFQQIAGNFENDVFNINLRNIGASQNKHFFKLNPSIVLWNAVEACFSPDVYIDQLADQFLRLSMLVLSRYISLLETLLSDCEENLDDYAINALIDFRILESLIAPTCTCKQDIERTIFCIINIDIWDTVLKIFKANVKVINKVQKTFQQNIITAKISECTAQLQNVCAIPRLYRRTNRNPPKSASPYMVEAVKPILQFHNKFKSKIDDHMSKILDSIIVHITKHYVSLVQEVLMSVCKTEESLRRLKSRSLPTSDGSSHGSSDTMSDETKIREQIKYDVGYFLDKIYNLGLSESKETMELLKREVY